MSVVASTLFGGVSGSALADVSAIGPTIIPQMAKRGRVARGAFADLTVFDPAKVVDRATFTEPALTSVGIPHVLVNGAFVVRDGALVAGARPGRAIRVPPKKP